MINFSKFIASNRTASQSGFTLIEMMVVVAIIGILAAIAIPNYRRYMVLNAESQAQAKMKQLQLELESWRASSLTYKGFVPKKVATDGTASFGYDDSANTHIKVPDATNTRYDITLLADKTGTTSLAPTGTTTFSTNGNAWRMLATPSSYLQGYGAKKILLTSTGLSCQSADSSFTIDATCNEVGAVKW